MAEDPNPTHHEREPISLQQGYEIRHWVREFLQGRPSS